MKTKINVSSGIVISPMSCFDNSNRSLKLPEMLELIDQDFA